MGLWMYTKRKPMTAVQICPGLFMLMKKTRDEEKAFERYQQIISLLNKAEDREGIALVQDLINKCIEYFEIIGILSSSEALKTGLSKVRRSLEAISEKRISAAEGLRSDKHNAAISQLEKVNR